MQQITQPSHHLNLQRITNLWLSVRHRQPGMVEQKTTENRGRLRTMTKELLSAIQDAETVEQNRQSLYTLVQGVLNNETLMNDDEYLERVLNDMLADHLTALSLNLEKAKEVQARFLPQALPRVTNLDLAATLRPATELSGDFYDFVEDDRGGFFFHVGDVSSKGMSAALLMPVLSKVLRSGIKFTNAPTPRSLLAFTQEDMYPQLSGSAMFASIFLGYYDPATRQLSYANAGHSPVIYKPKEGDARLLKADGPPVGLLPDVCWENHQITLAPGDLLLVGTDGIVDVRTSMRDMFGYERLLKAVNNLPQGSAKAVTNHLLSILHDFAPDELQEDDQALVIFKGI